MRACCPMEKSVPIKDPPARASDTAMRLRGARGLDVDAGLAFVGNSADGYVRLLQRFVQLHEHEVTDMVRQADRAEHPSLQHFAHPLQDRPPTLPLSPLSCPANTPQDAPSQPPPH